MLLRRFAWVTNVAALMGGTPTPVSGALLLEAGAGYLLIEGGTSHFLLE